jgi:N4-gp56 family major capsid protein
MAKTAFATNSAETKKLWESTIFEEMEIENFFSKYEGSIVHVNEELEKTQGDLIRFAIAMRLTGNGVTSGVTLEGNEEKLTTYTQDVSLQEYAHGIRDRGPLDRQRAMFAIDEVSLKRLKVWGAEKQERLAFTAMATSPTRIIYPAGASSKATLTTSLKFTPDLVSWIKAGAKTGWNRTQNPIERVRVKGKGYYLCLIHPDVADYDLFNDPIMTQAKREAEVRSEENPLWTGADAIWNGVVFASHELVPIGLDAGSVGNVPWTRSFFLGEQALLKAKGKLPEVVAEEFDYGREHGFGWGMIVGYQKTQFNSKDFAFVAIDTARSQISDA